MHRVDVFLNFSLITIMMTKRFTVIENMSCEEHLNLILSYMSAGTDILDLTDYANDNKIIELFDSVDSIYSNNLY